MSTRTFGTRNGHVTIDTATHKAVPKDAIVLDLDAALHGAPASLSREEFGRILARRIREDSIRQDSPNALVADQIEAQTKPPRIPEPGWGSVVEAHTSGRDERRRLIAVGDSLWLERHHDQYASAYKWSDLIDPVLIREGVES